MKRRVIGLFAAATVLGVVQHYLYQWIPVSVVGLFAPINESVWEHLKLLFWPVVVVGLAAGRRSRDPHLFWASLLTALLAMPLLLLGAYYILNGGFGVDSTVVDIGLYLLTMAAGGVIALKMRQRPERAAWLGWLLMAAGIYAVALLIFSISAPHLPIFTPKG